MSKQDLNKKLAEWAGCEMEYDRVYEKPLTESLDACFKWLWDKAVQQLADIDLSSIDEAICKLFQLWANEWVTSLSKEPALALCLAIEKLIDKE